MIFTLFILAFVIRIVFIRKGTSDSWLVNYSISGQIKNWLNYKAYNSQIIGFQGSAKLQYFIVSKFPYKFRYLFGNILNISYDLLVMLMLYFMASNLLINEENKNLILAIILAIYATSPILLPVTARLTGVKARTFGGLLSFCYFISLFEAFILHNYIFYPIAGLFVILIVLSSAFAAQVLILFSSFIAMYYLSLKPLLVIFIPCIIGYFIPFLGIREIILHKINHYRWYFNNYQGTDASSRNSLHNLFDSLKFNKLLSNPNKFFKEVFVRQSIIIALYSTVANSVLFYHLFKFSSLQTEIMNNLFWEYALVISTVTYIIFFITSLKPFLFLGEAERYFEYSVPFIALLYIPLTTKGNIVEADIANIIIFNLICVFLILLNNKFYEFIEANTEHFLEQEDKELIEMLVGIPYKNPVVMVVPVKYAFQLASFTPKSLGIKYLLDFITNNVDGFKYMKETRENYSSTVLNYSILKSKYQVNTLVTLNSYINNPLYEHLNESIKKFDKINENSKYTIFKILK